MKARLLWIIPILLLTACPKDKNARDAAAALKGALDTAQVEYSASCMADPTPKLCQTIKRAVAVQNLLITTTEAYCGWDRAAPMPTAQCVPVKSLEGALTSAVANANQAVGELKGIIK